MDSSVNANKYFSTLPIELARIDADRVSWRQALAQTDILAKQMREFSQINSASEEIARTMKALQSPAMTIAQQYQLTFRTSRGPLDRNFRPDRKF